MASVIVVATIFVIRIIKVMLKTEKQSKSTEQPKAEQSAEYVPENTAIDITSSNSNIVTDMSVKPNNDLSKSTGNYDEMSGNSFLDELDTEFADYSAHLKNRKNKRNSTDFSDFDLDGELADDFEYMPNDANFVYPNRKPPTERKKSIDRELNELPTELKVLMLSDIFDRKF